MVFLSGKLGKPNFTRIDYYFCNQKATMFSVLNLFGKDVV
jgi:hypothetical protein